MFYPVREDSSRGMKGGGEGLADVAPGCCPSLLRPQEQN